MESKSFFDIVKRIATLLTCLLMLAAIAIIDNKAILGHEFAVTSSLDGTQETDSLPIGTIIIHSADIDQGIYGYGGPTPLDIVIQDGRIESITPLRNAETPSFFQPVIQTILPQYIGKTISEAQALHVDAVSGATLSSNAVKANIQRALITVQPNETTDSKRFSIKHLLALIVALCAAVLPLFIHNKWYRLAQLIANTTILGIYTATFVSISSVTNMLSYASLSSIALALLLVIAFLYPLFGKPGYYCTWVCPLGSAQELMHKIPTRKWTIPTLWAKRLNTFRLILWAILMFLAWSGILLDWLDYELFTAFVWQSASWGLLAFGGITLVLSLFVTRPYCRFICPTGTLLKSL